MCIHWSIGAGFSGRRIFSFIGQIDLVGALSLIYLPFIFVFLFTNFIEALSTFLGLAEAADLKTSRDCRATSSHAIHSTPSLR